MSVQVIDTLKPKNGLDFPVVEAIDVSVEGYDSLADAVSHFVTDAAIATITAALDGKADKMTTDSLQAQIDQIAQAAGTGSADTEVAQARVDEDGISYPTLKGRLDNDSTKTSDILRYSTESTNELFINTGYINTEGSLKTNTAWRHTDYINVNDLYEAFVRANSSACSIAYYDSNKTFISGISGTGDIPKIVRNHNVPSGAVYCIVSANIYDTNSYIKIFNIKSYIQKVQDDVENIENYLVIKDTSLYKNVGYINNSGELNGNTNYLHTDLLNINIIKDAYFKANSAVCSIAFYDEDEEFISDTRYNFSDSNAHLVSNIEHPNNAVYCVVSTDKRGVDYYLSIYHINVEDEVVNARTDLNGVSHTSLKARCDSDNNEARLGRNEILDGEITINANWINGNLYNNGTISTSVSYRILTDNILSAERDLKIEAKDGFQFTIGLYNTENTLLFYVNVTDNYIIPKNARYRICIRRLTEDTSEIADVETFKKQVIVKYSDGYNLLDSVTPTTIGNATFTTANGYTSITIPASNDYSNGIFFPMELETGEMYCLSYRCCGVNRDTTISVDFALIGDTSSTDSIYDGEQRIILPSKEYKCSQFAIAREGCRGAILRIKSGNTRTYQFSEIQIVKFDRDVDFSLPNNSQIDEISRVKSDKAVKLATWNSKRIDNSLSTYKRRRPMVTIIDDDGNYQFYTMLYPLMLEYGIPMVTAYMADNNYRYPNMYMSKEQLADVIAAGGEIIGHTTGNLATMDIAVAEDTVSRCQRMFKANGVYTDLFVYPNGGNNEAVREMMAKYYSGAFTTFDPVRDNDNRTNYGCIANYRIKRVHCGGDAYDPIATTGRYANLDTSLMEYFEELIAETKEKNSWLVMYTHSFQIADGQVPTDGKSQIERLEEIIQYCISEGVDIVTASEGFEVFGNAWQAGDYLGEHNTDMTLHDTQGSAMNKLGQYDFPAINAINWSNL